MLTDNRELRFSIIIDPATGKGFVQDAARVFADVGDAAQTTAKRAGKSFADIFSTNALLRVAAAGFVLQRIARLADEPSERLRDVAAAAREAGAALGTELQAGAGAALAPLIPLIQRFRDASGAVHGLALGMTGLVFIGPRIIRVLQMIGLAAGPAGILVASVSLLAGTAIGLAGKAAADNEEKIRGFREQLGALGDPALTVRLQEIEQRLGEIRAENERLLEVQRQTIAMTEYGLEPPAPRFQRREKFDLEAEKTAIKQVIGVRGELAAVTLDRQKISQRTGSEIVAQLNLEIQLKEKTLSAARAEAKTQLAAAQARLAGLKNIATLQDYIAGLDDKTLQETYRRASVEEKVRIEKELQIRWANDVKAAEQDVNALLGARADLQTRITEQTAKERAEALHRKTLLAQNLDLLKGEGPLLERQVIWAEYLARLRRGAAASDIQMLELRQQGLQLDQQVAAARERRIAAVQLETDAERERLAAIQEFARAVDVSLLRLTNRNEEEFLRRRIGFLRQELGLQELTAAAIREKAAVLQLLALTPLEMGGLTEKEAEKKSAALRELVDLLTQAKQKTQELPVELAMIGQAVQQAAAQGTRALVQMFTRGKVDAQHFADAVRQIFEELLSQILARQFLMMLASMIPGFGPLLGIAGAAGGLAGGMRAGGGSAIRLPTPMPAGTARVEGLLTRMAGKMDVLANGIATLAAQPTQVTAVTVHGEVLRFAVERAAGAAAARKIG